MRRARLVSAVLAMWLSGCAVVPDSAEEAALRERPVKPQVHADLVQTMLAQGQNYAALAHIEELEARRGADTEQLRWLRATAQYKLGDLAASWSALICACALRNSRKMTARKRFTTKKPAIITMRMK